jgi:rhomboid protease GluP
MGGPILFYIHSKFVQIKSGPMPSEKQDLSFPGYTADQLLLYAYGTFLELGWTPKFAGPSTIVAHTPVTWNKNDDEVVVDVHEGNLTVTSNLIHNESFDMMKRNEKHINDFRTTFEKVKLSEPDPSWKAAIEKLDQQVIPVANEHEQQAHEIDKVMKFSSSNLYLTYGIIAINIVVFILMVIDGAGIVEPDARIHALWGSNYSPLTLSGDWWRLITSVFIHFGIFHLLLNMYALYMAGVYLEPMLGKAKFVVAYLSTGVIANLVSLWWHNNAVNGAGASGAIFGMYGVFLALLLTNLIPKQVRMALLQSIGIFIVLNVIYGMRGNVDNSAHIGGLLSGAVIGFMFYPLLKKGETGAKRNMLLAAIIGVSVLSAWMYLNDPGNKVSAAARQSELKYLDESAFPDSEKFDAMFKEFVTVDERIAALLSDNMQEYREWLNKNEKGMEKEIGEMGNIVTNMKNYQVSENLKTRIGLLEQYWITRKDELATIKLLAEENGPANKLKLADIRQKQGELITELNKPN